jgi:hypothetical protein
VSTADSWLIERLKTSVAEGKHWYVALLEAIRGWSVTEEDHNGRHYRYLLDNEAFDWLTLAERLCEELEGLIPESERTDLLFFGKPPVQLSRAEFRDLVGGAKYRTHLNYFYGVVVERFLILAVTEEIRKERRVAGLTRDDGTPDQAYYRVYGADRTTLLKQFRSGKCYPHLKTINLEELDEFTYWLFKGRVERSDKSCVASDTKKALAKLQELTGRRGRPSRSTVTPGARP